MGRHASPADQETRDQPARLRLDLWLFHARFARQRALAARLVHEGHVRIAGRRVTSPGHGVKAGDVLTLSLPGRTLVVTVVELGSRRGGASEAHRLYEVAAPETRPEEGAILAETLAAKGRTV